MHGEAKKRIAQLYPTVTTTDGRTLPGIAWFWARTVPSPDPRANGTPVPLVSSFVLSAKDDKRGIGLPVVDRRNLRWTFEIENSPSGPEVERARKGTKAARAC